MKIDQLARQTHRRGVLAALAALLVAPAATRAQALACSPRGGGCTLHVHCCGRVFCYRDPINPNSGVCGGIVRDTNPGPSFISPTSSSSSSSGPSSVPSPSDADSELPPIRDNDGDGDIGCGDFTDAEAQAIYDADPSDPYGLDGPEGSGRAGTGIYGVVCEDPDD